MSKIVGWNRVGGDLPPSVILAEGDSIEGLLLEKKEIADREENKLRKMYVIETENGKRTLWGSGLLDYLMSKIEIGTEVKVVYLGKKKVKIDGKIRNVNQHEVYTK